MNDATDTHTASHMNAIVCRLYLISYTRYALTHTRAPSKRQLQISPSVYEKPRETTH